MAASTVPVTIDRRQELAARTARDRAAFERAVVQLRRALRKELSVGDRLGEHPYPWLTGAFVLGVYMGLR